MTGKFSLKNMGNPKMIEGDDKIRVQKCNQEIKAQLKKDDALILPKFLITGIKIQSTFMVTIKPQVFVQAVITDKMRAEDTLAKVQVILDRYDCVIQPRLEFMGNNVRAGYATVAKPRIIPVGNRQN